MSGNVASPITSLSDAELQAAIEKQIKLIQSFGPKLPDRGARLQAYLKRLESELDIRTKTPMIVPQVIQSSLLSIMRKGVDPVHGKGVNRKDNVIDANRTKVERSSQESIVTDATTTDLVEQLSCLAIHTDECNVDENEKINSVNEDMTQIPSITLKETIQFRYLLGLPALVVPTFRWFVFAIRLIEDFIYLAIIDCSNPERFLVRTGPASTWFPGLRTKNEPNPAENGTKWSALRTPLAQPAEALRDFWGFVSPRSPTLTSTVSTNHASTPCLICCTCSNFGNQNELIWLSRLLRQTRHYNVARINMPRDCRFVDASHIFNRDRSEQHNTIDDGDSDATISERIHRELKAIRNDIFVEVKEEKSREWEIKFRHYKSSYDFLKDGVTRSLPWMEAALEYEFLLELKESNALSERLQNSVRLSSNKVNNANRGLQHVPNAVLRRLASVGLGRTRLTRLAGLAGWYGFAGLLAFRLRQPDPSACELSTTERASAEDSQNNVFVTNDLPVLQDLYAFFSRIYGHMDRHDRYYEEVKSNRKISGLRVPYSNPTIPCVDNPTRVQAWVGGGNALFHPNAPRHLHVLTVEESINLMKNVQKAYQEARMKRSLPNYPSLPPESTKLYRYRDIHCESESSDEEGSSDTEAPDQEALSDTSLHLEDVD